MKRKQIAKEARTILNGTEVPLSRLADKAGVNYSNLRRVLLPKFAEESGALVELGYLRDLAKALRAEAKRATEAARSLEDLERRAKQG